MDNINVNKKIKYYYNDKKYLRDPINNINHTNINNNINITNYYPSQTQNYCNKQTFTFIDENGIVQNAISYPIKTTTHKTNKIKESSHTPSNYEKKYQQCQSPYMKKILPPSKREKSEENKRVIKIYNTSSSHKYLKIIKNSINNNVNKQNLSPRKIEKQNNNNKNNRNNNNHNLDISTDEINNKFKRIIEYKNYANYNSEIKEINNTNYKKKSKPVIKKIKNKNLIIYNESNGNESQINYFKKPYQFSIDKNPLYKNTSSHKKNIIKYEFNSPKIKKSQNKKNNSYNKGISVQKKLTNYIILIQSAIRGFLLRIKLGQYLNLYERIKKGVSIIQFIIIKRVKYTLYYIIQNINNINNNNYKNRKYTYLSPGNYLSLEFKKMTPKSSKISRNDSFNINNYKNKTQLKNPEFVEMQKELNKKKIDFAVAEKRIKELLLENKKIQNINNIIVRDNKQLAIKLKNSLNNCFNNLKIENKNFDIITLTNKNEINLRRNKLLTKIINKKDNLIKKIIYKNFYKFNFLTKLISIKEINETKKKNNLIIQNNNFAINKNIINNDDNMKISIDIRNNKLKFLINKKNNNLYMYRNIFEKWMMRSLIFKSKEFIKEKKKKKKEKFKQRKQKRLYGYYLDRNDKDKKTNEDNENSGDSDDFFEEPKNNNFTSNKQNNNYYENYKK